MPKRPLLGSTSGRQRSRHAEQRRSSSSDQSQRADVVEQRAARVRRVGRVHAAVGAAGEVPEDPRVDGAEREVGVGVDAARREAATRASSPRSTGRARARSRARTAARALRRGARRSAPRCGGPARRSRGGAGAPVRAVPDDDRLALVGDADRGDGLARSRRVAAATSASVSSVARPDVVGVVLDPARAAGSAAGTRGTPSASVRPSSSTASVRTPVVPASIASTTAIGAGRISVAPERGTVSRSRSGARARPRSSSAAASACAAVAGAPARCALGRQHPVDARWSASAGPGPWRRRWRGREAAASSAAAERWRGRNSRTSRESFAPRIRAGRAVAVGASARA